MIINNREYKEFENVYFIAEVGINHNGSLDIAKEIIEMASLHGANAIKFQKRDPKKIWSEEYLNRPYNNDYSFGQTYGEHKSFLEFEDEQYFECDSCISTIHPKLLSDMLIDSSVRPAYINRI